MGIRDVLNELDYLDQLARNDAAAELASRQWIFSVVSFIEAVLGIAVYFMLAFFSLIILLDMLYFNLPPVQSWVDNLHDNNEGKKRFTRFLISSRAKLAMDKSYITGQNVSIIYMVKMIPMVCMIAAALAYAFMEGNAVVHDFLWNMADLIIGMLESWSR